MSEEPDERTLLMEEAHDLCEEIDAGIDDLRHLIPRFRHVWPANLQLEPIARRIARIRTQLSNELGLNELRKLIAMLETEKTNLVRDAQPLWARERNDRYRYRD